MATVPTPRGRATRMSRDARRAQVLDVALQAFARDGYHHVSMDDIAERALVSKPVLYRHFASKLDLYLATIEQRGAYLDRTVHAAIDAVDLRSATPEEAHELVRALVRTYFEFVEALGAGSPAAFEADATADPHLRERVERAGAGSVESITRTLAEITGVGEADAMLMAHAVTSMARAAAADWLRTENALALDDAVTLVSRLAWGGIRQFIPETASIRS